MIRHLARVPGWGYWLAGLGLAIGSLFTPALLRNSVLLTVGLALAVTWPAVLVAWLDGEPPEKPVKSRPAPRRSLPALKARAEVSQPGPRALVGEVLPRRHELEGGKR